MTYELELMHRTRSVSQMHRVCIVEKISVEEGINSEDICDVMLERDGKVRNDVRRIWQYALCPQQPLPAIIHQVIIWCFPSQARKVPLDSRRVKTE